MMIVLYNKKAVFCKKETENLTIMKKTQGGRSNE